MILYCSDAARPTGASLGDIVVSDEEFKLAGKPVGALRAAVVDATASRFDPAALTRALATAYPGLPLLAVVPAPRPLDRCRVLLEAGADDCIPASPGFEAEIRWHIERLGWRKTTCRESWVRDVGEPDFVRGVLHDLRGYIATIKTLAEVSRLQKGMPPEASELLERMDKHLSGATRLIDDLSRAIQTRSRTFDVRPGRTPVLEEIRPLLAAYRRLAADRGVALVASYATPVPDAVETDGLRLAQIVSNLLANAVNYTARGAIEVSLAYDRDELRVAVRDSGAGIRPELKEKIFEPFERGDAAKAGSPGTGLGLTISRTLARAMGGDVELVQSEPGRGSIFACRVRAGRIDGARLLGKAGEELPSG